MKSSITGKARFECSGFIADGCTRNVYESKHWPKTRVVKIDSGSGDNLREWKQWKAANKELRRYLAPCYAISRGGKYLLMHRTKPASLAALTAARIPSVINYDAHRNNLGKIGSRIVMHDYAFHVDFFDPVTDTGPQFDQPCFCYCY